MTRWPRAFLIFWLRLYRRYISPLKPPMCRFHPTCSQYAIEALSVHGVFRGTWLATWRLLRCQPFSKGGFDPVPLPEGAERDRCSHDHESDARSAQED